MKNWILIFICVAGFIGQMIYITINLLNKPPITERNKNRLADEQFPLVFKICVAEHGDPSTRYKKFGYDNEEQFFTGQSKLNKSVRGWLGHSEQNDYDLEEIQSSTNVNWTDIIERIQVFGSNESDKVVGGGEIMWPKVQQHLSCTIFDPVPYFGQFNYSEIFITPKKKENMGMTIFIQDRNRMTSRTLLSNFQSYSGPTIEIHDLSKPSLKKYFLSLEQQVSLPEIANCENYSDEHKSFYDCDKSFVKNECQKIGVMPAWATDDSSEVTKSIIDVSPKMELRLWELFDGSKEPDCLDPCRTTKTQGSQISSIAWENEHSILLVLNPYIIEYSTYYEGFSWAEFFADLGGSVGLWLGPLAFIAHFLKIQECQALSRSRSLALSERELTQ